MPLRTLSDCVPCDVPPFRLSGTVYGTLLNHRTAVAALGEAVHQPPYKAPPVAPVLYVKPRNTLGGDDDPVQVPRDVAELEIGACLGLVIGRAACRVAVQDALTHVAGYVIVNDVSVPHAQFFRPSVRYKARDGYCPLGPCVTPRASVGDPNALGVRVYVDGAIVHESNTRDLVRSVERLLADVTEFMTLAPGDVLAVGVAAPPPRARAGQHARIEIDGLGALRTPFVAEDA